MRKILRTLDPLVQPVMKWAGGKRQLLPEIKKFVPVKFVTYYEPFIGGAAVLFAIQPQKAVINDFNAELVNIYRIIKEFPEELIMDLTKHKYESNYFYQLRGMDRTHEFSALSDIQRASRTICLNKTCFNGLYRVNSQGYFNVPFGKYNNPNIVNAITIRAVSRFLKSCDVKILSGDFEKAVVGAKKGDFVYFDPPYVPLSDTANFTNYTLDGFLLDDQVRLKKLCDTLSARGVNFLLSNSSAPVILDLYKGYKIEIVGATRAINSVAKKRGKIDEVLVRNYECEQ